jgi:hypothetical protein
VPNHDNPERFLAAALRAQATGGQGRPPDPVARPASTPRLPWMRILLFAVVIGLVAGVVAGVVSLA